MDSRTVRAFMVVYGYAEKYAAQDVPAIDAARMESDTLGDALADQGIVDMTPYFS